MIMWEEIAIKIGIKAVEKFFDGLNKQDNDVIAVGLAVGYYYNFLDPVSDAIDRDAFELFSAAQGDNKTGQFSSMGTFQSADVRVQIIIPGRLDVSSFQRCEEEFKSLQKGFLLLPKNKRYYGINYSTTSLASRTELMIVDLARPIMSAKRYYEDIVRMDTSNDLDEKWLKIQVAEITAFKESLRRLQKRGYGGLVNKLDFRERT
jgi:hypothetical protein